MAVNGVLYGPPAALTAGTDYVAPDVAIASGKKLIIDSSNSLTSVALQISGDANSGIAQVGGADTVSIVCGGAEVARFSGTALSMTTITANFGSTNYGSASNVYQTGASLTFATTGAGTKIGTGATQKMGFWNTTPIVQPNGTGETVGFTAGVGTAVKDDSTFTGNVGSTAYRISDVVKALKNSGLIAQ